MNIATYANTTHVLKQILASDPQASLDVIRDAHPAFRTMSPDQLGLRLSRVIESQYDDRAK